MTYDPTYAGPITGEPDGFNAAWYLAQNADVLDAIVNKRWFDHPLTHWMLYGSKAAKAYDGKGRQPFDPSGDKAAPAPKRQIVGINLPGYEAWGGEQRYGYGWILPSMDDVRAFVARDMPIRLPFNWGRFQTAPFGPLIASEVARFRAWLVEAKGLGARVQPENHGYATTGWGQPLDTSPGCLADFSVKMVQALGDTIAGYGLMNEPAGVGEGAWYREAQAAVTAVGKVNAKLPLFVCGHGYSGAGSWPTRGPLDDPNGQIIYEAHVYPDGDASGTFRDTRITPFAERAAPFLAWLRKYGVRGSIGEFGALDTPEHVAAVKAFVTVLRNEPLVESAYYWCGNGWGDTRLAARLNGQDKPQMAALLPA